MKVCNKRLLLVLALILGVVVLAVFLPSTSTKSGAWRGRTQVRLVSQWRLSFLRYRLSLEPSMARWQLNIGPLLVLHSQPDRTIMTNATFTGNSNSISK